MHIPSAPTDTLSLLTFDEALARSGRSGGYDPARWLYVPDFYTEYRYLLGTRGERPLLCIGVNPSTAEPDALDAIAEHAFYANEHSENIGARRLHTELEKMLSDIAFNAGGGDGAQVKVTIDATYVESQLKAETKRQDLSRYIL